MTIRHLKVFICVVENNGITKAADKLYIAQPAVSQTIAELEKHYGVKLFDRLNRKLYLTPYGDRLLEYARSLCGNFDDIEREFASSSDGGYLRIGATVTIGTCLLPNYLAKFTNADKYKINVEVSNTKAIEKLILQSKIDISLVEGSIESKDIVTIPFYQDEIIFVAKDKTINTDCIIVREAGSGSRDIVVSNLNKLAITPTNIWTISNTEGIINMLECGIGFSAISKLLVKKQLENGTLIDLKFGLIKREFSIAYHKDKIFSDVINNFIKIVKDNK